MPQAAPGPHFMLAGGTLLITKGNCGWFIKECTEIYERLFRSLEVSRYTTIRSFFTKESVQNTNKCYPTRPFSVNGKALGMGWRNPAITYHTVGPMCRPFNEIHTRHFHQSQLLRSTPNPGEPSNDPLKHESTTNAQHREQPQPLEKPPGGNDHSHLQDYSRFFRQLALSVPHLSRPTRDDLLNVTSSFWKRLRIRFKWFTIKSFRKFNADDLSAFFSFALVGQTIWILIGT